MSVESARVEGHVAPHGATGPSTQSFLYRAASNRLGLWLFFVSDSFVFGGLLVSRFYLLGNTRPHLEQWLGLLVTVVLLVSSFFINRAEVQMSMGDQKGFIRSTLITIVLGTLFLIGVVGVEWQLAPFSVGESAEAAIFFMMTGMHAFHVLTGIIFLIIILRNGMRGKYTAERHWGVEAAANYWHFVDVVWIIYYPALYLIGTL
jgi:cytochrome c oxidase subunit III